MPAGQRGAGGVIPRINGGGAGKQRDGWGQSTVIAQRAEFDGGGIGYDCTAGGIIRQVIAAAGSRAAAVIAACPFDEKAVEQVQRSEVVETAAAAAVVREGAVGDGHCAAVDENAAAIGAGAVAGKRAVVNGQRAVVLDGAAADIRVIVRKGHVVDGRCAASGQPAAI
jgi:hypothetical protein